MVVGWAMSHNALMACHWMLSALDKLLVQELTKESLRREKFLVEELSNVSLRRDGLLLDIVSPEQWPWPGLLSRERTVPKLLPVYLHLRDVLFCVCGEVDNKTVC